MGKRLLWFAICALLLGGCAPKPTPSSVITVSPAWTTTSVAPATYTPITIETTVRPAPASELPTAVTTGRTPVPPVIATVQSTLQPVPVVTATFLGTTPTKVLPASTATSFRMPTGGTVSAGTPSATPSPIPSNQRFTDCDVVTDIPPEECQVLVVFYNRYQGEYWQHHDGWLSTNTPCAWYGVTCTAGHVTALVMHENNLLGPLPPELAKLSHLEILDLSFNLLVSGSIPYELSQLKELHTLDLSFNFLHGEIPYQLGRLSKLRILNLRDNQLEGSIPPELGLLTELRTLNLRDNLLSGDIPVELTDLSNLEILNLQGDKLTGSLPSEIGKLAHLRQLRVNFTALSGELPADLRNLKLEVFSFAGTDLCEPADAIFQQWLVSIPTVERTRKCGG